MSQSTEGQFRVRGQPHPFRRDDWPRFIEDYDYELDPALIAQSPAPRRDESKLLVVRRNPARGMPRFEDLKFSDLEALTKSEGLHQSPWVRNRTKVFEARLYAQRPTGSVHEIVLVRERSDGRWDAIIRNIKRFDFPQKLQLVENPDIVLHCPEPNVIEFPKDGPSIFEICRAHGEMPLPPYIKERSKERDQLRYQSIWAQQARPASVAAPTASLHFTEELCAKLSAGGVRFLDIELDVGLGTFEPLRDRDIHLNHLHRESFRLSGDFYRQLEEAYTQEHSIFCVGTTAMRCLESLPLGGNLNRSQVLSVGDDNVRHGETSIFIKPGTDILYTSQLLTNFHLPQSSLFVLVATFAGSTTLAIEAYRHAVAKKYRFFSYGDATLWL